MPVINQCPCPIKIIIDTVTIFAFQGVAKMSGAKLQSRKGGHKIRL